MTRRNLLLSVLLATAIGSRAGAQERAASLDVEAIRAVVIGGFENAKALDVAFARAIPDSAMRWSPSPDVRDFSQQLSHAANNLFLAGALFGVASPSFGDSARYLNDKLALEEAVTAAYDWIIEQVGALPADDLLEIGELFGQRKPKWQLCLYALDHAMWTRGQMVSYYRAHGQRPPQWRSAY